MTTILFQMGDHEAEEEGEGEGSDSSEHHRRLEEEEEEEEHEEEEEDHGEEEEDHGEEEGEEEHVGEPTTFMFAFFKFFQDIPLINSFYHYEGSLTTPSCDEDVNWYISKNIIRVNNEQLEEFKNLWIVEYFNDLADEG
jgi:hypothetical protein